MRIVARRMLGAGVGVALSCGNLRGLAHLGILRGLARAGIELDAIAGCSIGAAIGGLHAMGTDPEAALAHLSRREPRVMAAQRLGKAP